MKIQMEYWREILGPVVGEVAADPDGAFVQLGHFQLNEQSKTEVQGSNPGH